MAKIPAFIFFVLTFFMGGSDSTTLHPFRMDLLRFNPTQFLTQSLPLMPPEEENQKEKVKK